MKTPDFPLVFTVKEIAELLEVSKNTAYHLVRSGKLRSVKIGRQFRVPKSALEDYLAGIEAQQEQLA